MANFYIAVSVKQDKNERIFTDRLTEESDPGFYAYIIRCTESDNLKSRLESIGGLVNANIYPTKKKAAAVVEQWNATYKANGEYLFSCPAF